MPKIIFLMAGLTGAAGVVLVALGIPIQEFGLGNTLIGSGLVSLVGALVLFALGAVLRELKDIAQILLKQPPAPTFGNPAPRYGDLPDIPFAPSPRNGTLPFGARGESAHEDEPEQLLRSERIVKSGVVDGLAYTLYADGSIDAELEEGTLRFGSVDQLQSYLRKTA